MSQDPATVDRDATVAMLVEENERLRREYRAARRTAYRRSASALVALGALAVLAAIVVPPVREVLLVLGAIGLFGGIITYYLTPERFVAAAVGERVYAAMAENQAAIADTLGLREETVYIPDEHTVAVYVPDRATETIPAPVDGPIVTDPATRGLVLESTGAALLETLAAPASERSLPARAHTLADALVEQFELVDAATVEVDAEMGRADVRLSGSTFGAPDRFDHPTVSLLAAGLADHLGEPVRPHVTEAAGDDDWVVVCQWEP